MKPKNQTAALCATLTLLTALLGFYGCSEDTEVQYAPYDKKELYDGIKAHGCWQRYAIEINGTVEKYPWMAFYLEDNGSYYQIADPLYKYRDQLKEYDEVTPQHEKYWFWDEEEKGVLTIWAGDKTEVKITGYYSPRAKSLIAKTTVYDDRNTTYRDVLMKGENHKAAWYETGYPPLCQKLVDRIKKDRNETSKKRGKRKW